MSDNPVLMTQAQYARQRNKIPNYIGILFEAGILVMRGLLWPWPASPPRVPCGVWRIPARARVWGHSATSSKEIWGKSDCKRRVEGPRIDGWRYYPCEISFNPGTPK